MISFMDSIASELSSSVCINTLVMPIIPYVLGIHERIVRLAYDASFSTREESH
jgi:hypothetical protein